VVTQPVDELSSVDAAGRQVEHDALLIIHSGVEFGAVQDEERFHGGMAETFVAVDEGVVFDQRGTERSASGE